MAATDQHLYGHHPTTTTTTTITTTVTNITNITNINTNTTNTNTNNTNTTNTNTNNTTNTTNNTTCTTVKQFFKGPIQGLSGAKAIVLDAPEADENGVVRSTRRSSFSVDLYLQEQVRMG